MNDLPKVTQLLAGRAQGRICVYVAGPLDTGGCGTVFLGPSPGVPLPLWDVPALWIVICRLFLPEHGPQPWQNPGTEG